MWNAESIGSDTSRCSMVLDGVDVYVRMVMVTPGQLGIRGYIDGMTLSGMGRSLGKRGTSPENHNGRHRFESVDGAPLGVAPTTIVPQGPPSQELSNISSNSTIFCLHPLPSSRFQHSRQFLPSTLPTCTMPMFGASQDRARMLAATARRNRTVSKDLGWQTQPVSASSPPTAGSSYDKPFGFGTLSHPPLRSLWQSRLQQSLQTSNSHAFSRSAPPGSGSTGLVQKPDGQLIPQRGDVTNIQANHQTVSFGQQSNQHMFPLPIPYSFSHQELSPKDNIFSGRLSPHPAPQCAPYMGPPVVQDPHSIGENMNIMLDYMTQATAHGHVVSGEGGRPVVRQPHQSPENAFLTPPLISGSKHPYYVSGPQKCIPNTSYQSTTCLPSGIPSCLGGPKQERSPRSRSSQQTPLSQQYPPPHQDESYNWTLDGKPRNELGRTRRTSSLSTSTPEIELSSSATSSGVPPLGQTRRIASEGVWTANQYYSPCWPILCSSSFLINTRQPLLMLLSFFSASGVTSSTSTKSSSSSLNKIFEKYCGRTAL